MKALAYTYTQTHIKNIPSKACIQFAETTKAPEPYVEFTHPKNSSLEDKSGVGINKNTNEALNIEENTYLLMQLIKPQ